MVASGGFTYDPTILESASKELSGGSSAVDSELTALRNKLEPLHQGFQGQAAQQFEQLWIQWHDSAKQLKASLDGLSHLLHGAAQNAAQMEEANKRLMQQR
ncbi:MAG: WXG100 family type VII secretion target [Mycobacteriaceae bacterium]